jgi:2-oxoglutarate ferredoxin oxidoreductase subunit beta
MSKSTLLTEKMSFKGDVSPNWCPGCGDYGLLASLTRTLDNLGYSPHEVVIVSGIGCSSNFPHFTSAYGFHSVHGRALPAAMAIKLVNPDLKVIAVGGDGDGYGIGLGHFIHNIRRNLDITYMIMNNQIYGLTLGQASPTSALQHVTITSPEGVDENPINPITLALGAGASFVARGFSGKTKQLEKLIEKGIHHPGFSFIDVLSPCVTFNRLNTYNWFKDRVYDLQEAKHNTESISEAFSKGLEWNEKIPLGLFYENPISSVNDKKINVLKLALDRNQKSKISQEIIDSFR